jgi:hypothetical protein
MVSGLKGESYEEKLEELGLPTLEERKHQVNMLQTVFWIHDILVWIRIRGSRPLTNGSGSGSWIRILDPYPAIFVIDLQGASKKKFLYQFFACYFLKVHLHYFSKIKSQKESQNSRIQDFFCMMIEGSGSGSGSIPLTSGSGRPKKHVDPVNPEDPEHWLQIFKIVRGINRVDHNTWVQLAAETGRATRGQITP